MSDLIVAFDFDGVMFPLMEALDAWWRRTGRPGVVPAETTTWAFYREMGLTEAEWVEALAAFGEDDGYRSVAPYPEALAGVTAIFDGGAGCIGVTSRPPTPVIVRSTYGFVADYYLPLRSVHIGPVAKLEAEYDVLVDDNPVELERLAEMGEAAGLLLARPYNVGAPFPRVSWEELPPLIDALDAQLKGVSDGDRRDTLADVLAEMVD